MRAVVAVPGHRLAVSRSDQHQRPRDRRRRRRQTARGASTPPTRRAASGRPTTTARRGRRSSSTGHRRASATSPSRRRIRTSSGSAPARPTCSAPRWPGVGVYKSTDGGRTFTHAGLDRHPDHRPHRRPSDRIRTSSTSRRPATSGPTTRCAASSRRPTAAGRGPKVLYKSPRTGAIDLVMDPADPNTLYAAMWQRVAPQVERPARRAGLQRRRHLEDDRRRTGRGPRSNQGLPAPRVPRPDRPRRRALEPERPLRVRRQLRGRAPAAARASATRTAARSQEARIKAAEIYRTDDKGETWRKVSESNEFMTGHSGTYGWVFGQIRVDPTDENTIYTLGLGLNVSRDAGKTFASLRGMHGDHHGLWIDPANPAILYNANDGGFYRSADAGKTWKFARAAGGAQFYNVTLDTSTPAGPTDRFRTTAAGAAGRSQQRPRQDSRRSSGRTRRAAKARITRSIRPTRHRLLARVLRQLHAGRCCAVGRRRAAPRQAGADSRAGPWPRRVGRDEHPAAGRVAERSGAARAVDGADHHLAARPRRSSMPAISSSSARTNRGDSWETISPDLTATTRRDAAEELERDSVPDDHRAGGVAAKKGLLYAGTDDGKLHVTIDGGKTWTELTAARADAPLVLARRAVAARRRHRLRHAARPRRRRLRGVRLQVHRLRQDVHEHRGQHPGRVGERHPRGSDGRERRSTSGTDFGAFVSTDGGRQWQVLGGNLPSVQVSDLQVHPRDNLIVISTYGRGMWAIDALPVAESLKSDVRSLK